MERIVVYEVNEVPLRVLEWYAASRQHSAVSRFLSSGVVRETENRDDLVGRELYPSQTWATLSTGLPLDKHNVYWYADPKPSDFPLYWQAAALQRSVGVLGALHSSPLDPGSAPPGLKFCVPDTFAQDPTTIPQSLTSLQQFNLSMTSRNARAVGSTFPLSTYLGGLAGVLRSGVGLRTHARLMALAVKVASGRVPKERLRSGQAMLMFDVFARQMELHKPDLGVFFTNHVASAMHRFWFASFPQDWNEELYDAAWVERNAGELPAALDELDRHLQWLMDFCDRNGRKLIMVSSMGQHGGEPLRDKSPEVFVVRNPAMFLDAIGLGAARERAAMVPQVSAEFPSECEAVDARVRLVRDFEELTVDIAGNVLTITYDLPCEPDGVILGGVPREAVEIGGEVTPVKEHRNGMHHPIGVLISYPGNGGGNGSELVDSLEVAPALLRTLGIEPEPHHVATGLEL